MKYKKDKEIKITISVVSKLYLIATCRLLVASNRSLFEMIYSFQMLAMQVQRFTSPIICCVCILIVCVCKMSIVGWVKGTVVLSIPLFTNSTDDMYS